MCNVMSLLNPHYRVLHVPVVHRAIATVVFLSLIVTSTHWRSFMYVSVREKLVIVFLNIIIIIIIIINILYVKKCELPSETNLTNFRFQQKCFYTFDYKAWWPDTFLVYGFVTTIKTKFAPT